MNFSYQIGMCDADHYLPLVKAVEDAGFDGITIADSICYPEVASSKYPYNKDGSREFLESVPFLESLIAVAAMAAVTEKIRFATMVYKLAVRQAAVVAKQVQSIQLLSGNRFDFGVGISPWEEDFAVCDVPWEKRGKRSDEYLEVLRTIWSGSHVEFHGEFVDFEPLTSTPRPPQGRDIPILVGGDTAVAMRRAARLADGYFPGESDEGRLGELITTVRAACENLDRDPDSIEINARFGRHLRDPAAGMEIVNDLSIGRAMVPAFAFAGDGGLDRLREFGETHVMPNRDS